MKNGGDAGNDFYKEYFHFANKLMTCMLKARELDTISIFSSYMC